MFTSLYFHIVYYPKAGNSFTKYIHTHYYLRLKQQQKPLLSEKKLDTKHLYSNFLELKKV
jgi:hypothetical protein